MKTIIFDFDGTIADTFPFVFEIVKELAPKYGYEPLSATEIEGLREMSFRNIVGKYHVGPIRILRMTLDAHRANAKRISETKVFPGMKEALLDLGHKGYRLMIMSSNSKKNIKNFLENNGLTLFEGIDTSLSLFGKGRKLEGIIRRLRLSKKDVIYVGDEVRDFDAARDAGIKAINVDWGYNTAAVLKQSNDAVVSTSSELVSLIEKTFK